MLLLLVACGPANDPPDDKPGNTPPTVTIALDPLAPTALDVVVATATTHDEDGDAVAVAWRWTRDGADVGLTTDTLPAGTAARGETWSVLATPSDGEDDGEPAEVTFTIGNAPPTLQSVVVGPTGATVADTLTATFAGAEDADGDDVSVEVTWSVDGTAVWVETVGAGDTATLAGVFAKGQEVVVTATPTDGEGAGLPVVSAALLVADSPPSATGARVAPDPLYVDSVATCVGEGWSDADGDAEGWQVAWTVYGAAVSSEATLPVGLFARGDTVACTLVPDDGELAGEAVTSADVVVSNSAPRCDVAAVTIGPDPATLGDAIAVATDGYAGCADPDGDAIVQIYDWRVDGVSAFSTASIAAGSVARGSTVTLVAGWSDGVVLGGEATSNTIDVVNRAPVASAITFSPASPTTEDTLGALVATSDADGDTLSLDYAWTIDGVGAGSDATLTGFTKGQTVSLTATPRDDWEAGTPASASVVIANAAPTAPTVAIAPTRPSTDDALVCTIAAATDADGDALSYTFAWTVGGIPYASATTTLFSGDTVPASVTTNGQTWTCSVSASDGTVAGETASASVVVGCDLDGDGHDALACGGDDCDDDDDALHAGATEVCDAADVDEDCDGLADDADPSLSATVYYPDADGDTYGDRDAGVAACSRPAGWLTNGDDCDDTRSAVKPGATERCDDLDLDEDCDGLAEDADSSVTGQTTQYPDGDGDGYGEEGGASTRACDLLAGYATSQTDCDDTTDAVNPGAEEVCADGVDNDCDGTSFPCGIEGSRVEPYASFTGTYGFGYSASVGDFDGNGDDDLIVGSSNLKKGHVWLGPITSGTRASTTSDVTLDGPAAWTDVGTVSAAIPDTDGDGDDEILLSAKGSFSGYDYAALLVGGDPDLASMELDDSTLLGSASGSASAPAMGGAGDVDGDGYGDLYLGSMRDTSSFNKLTVYLGDVAGDLEAVEYTTTAAGGFGDRYGVAYAGDMDGDGLGDTLARLGEGGVFVLAGDPAPVSSSLSVASDAWVTFSDTYSYVCAPGDVDGDGYADAGVSIGNTVYLLLGPPTGAVTKDDAFATVPGFDCRSGDTDDDGVSETFAWTNGGTPYRYPQPLEAGAHTTADAAGSTSANTSAAALGDLTDDGYVDFVTASYTGSVNVYTGGEW
jgi:hypothetical protein